MRRRKITIVVSGLAILALALLMLRKKTGPPPTPTEPAGVKIIEQQMDHLLDRSEPSERTLALPPPPRNQPSPSTETPKPDAKTPDRSQPPPPVTMGVVLFDNLSAYETFDSTVTVLTLQTGDLLEIKNEMADTGRQRVRPRVDVFLAATTQLTEAVGQRYPDRPVWVAANRIEVLPADQAVIFTQTTEPMTLGNNDPNFSTYDFYLRAMKNPDPAVHRIMGSRLIALASLHEEYSSIWSSLYHDRDPAVREKAVAVSQKIILERKKKQGEVDPR